MPTVVLALYSLATVMPEKPRMPNCYHVSIYICLRLINLPHDETQSPLQPTLPANPANCSFHRYSCFKTVVLTWLSKGPPGENFKYPDVQAPVPEILMQADAISLG